MKSLFTIEELNSIIKNLRKGMVLKSRMITDGIGGVAISLDNEETEALMRQAADILVDNRDKICNK